MYGRRLPLHLLRNPIALLSEARRGVLSASFSMNDEWKQSQSVIEEFTRGREYEWIAAVHKKFTSSVIPR